MNLKKPEQFKDDIYLNISQEMVNTSWDQFVENSLNGQYEQTSGWAKAKSIYGWQPVRIMVFKGEKIIGGVQILKKSFPFLGAIGYATKGPVFASYEKGLFIVLMDLLKKVLRKHRIQYFILQLPDQAKSVET